jgi:hypothetical protein
MSKSPFSGVAHGIWKTVTDHWTQARTESDLVYVALAISIKSLIHAGSMDASLSLE